MFLAIPQSVFIISKIIMFFVATIFVFRAMQALDTSKIFKNNSTDQIRFLYMIVAIILGYLFVDAVISILESVNTLLQ
ncbi:MAG: DUF1146 domain-containing protein [Bacilli bacterium]|nr:DUF1146 domain-containing protein [Bacilli bacterium]MBN2877292.1 DUF1146 domain-containing protein [Bacilli bacterium]